MPALQSGLRASALFAEVGVVHAALVADHVLHDGVRLKHLVQGVRDPKPALADSYASRACLCFRQGLHDLRSTSMSLLHVLPWWAQQCMMLHILTLFLQGTLRSP